MGPIEYAVIGFPGNQFNGQIAPALQELVESGIIRILDLIFIYKDANGEVAAFELEQMSEALSAEFEVVDGEVGYLVSQSDLQTFGAMLPVNTSAGVLVWENVWAERFAQAVLNSGGELIENARIPYALVQAALAYAEGQSA
jgi:hypothetical protein